MKVGAIDRAAWCTYIGSETAQHQRGDPSDTPEHELGARAAILDCEASICNRELAADPTPPPPPSRGQIIAQVEECALLSVSGWQAGLERHACARMGARAAILNYEASICNRELAAAPTPPLPPSQCVESRLSTAERVHPYPPSAPYSPTARQDIHIGLVHTSAKRDQYLASFIACGCCLRANTCKCEVSVRVSEFCGSIRPYSRSHSLGKVKFRFT